MSKYRLNYGFKGGKGRHSYEFDAISESNAISQAREYARSLQKQLRDTVLEEVRFVSSSIV